MAKPTTFLNLNEAYEKIKTSLNDKGYAVDNFKEIQNGIQFYVETNQKKEIIRLYSSQQGISLDLSQVKDLSLKEVTSASVNPSEIDNDKLTKQREKGRILSLCVGINDFADGTFVSLQFAAKDAEELNALLFEKFGYGEGTIKLVNGQATLKEITNNLIKLKEISKPEDTVLIFLATHGEFAKVKGDSDYYLIASDTDSKNYISTALPMSILKKCLLDLPAKNRIVFIDSCFSGGICRRDSTEISPKDKENIMQNLGGEDFIIITSCLETETSNEYDSLQHGVFTYYLLSGLTGAVESKDNLIDLYFLYVYINQEVKSYVKENSKRNQTPRFFGNLRGQILIPKLKELSKPQKGANLVEYSKEPLDNKTVKLSFETIKCIGIDESGKGDYFGPLVVAGVYVDTEDKISKLRALGVKDSKKIPDTRIKLMALRIRKICSKEEVFITPFTYNQLYRNMGNLNEILAWAHAQSLERLLERNPGCDTAISDQFTGKEILLNKLKEKGKKINLIQRPKAEENIAVAAASILARAKFLELLEQMEDKYNQRFSKGVNQHVIDDAKKFLSGGGKLEEVAKLHFKTTETVLKND